jgi:hypothetical protein
MLAFASERIQRCVDAGVFAPTTNAEVTMHLIWGALTGPAVIGSGCRLSPGEDPDALARDVLELMIAGLRSGTAATTFVPCMPLSDATPFIEALASDGARPHDS